jgi:hypothetical protein
MGIESTIVGTDGKKIASVEDPTNILHRILPSHDNARYQHLNRIDWYGDTTFNRHQLPDFRSELQTLMRSVDAPEHKELLDRIGALAARCETQPHLYLKFIGD